MDERLVRIVLEASPVVVQHTFRLACDMVLLCIRLLYTRFLGSQISRVPGTPNWHISRDKSISIHRHHLTARSPHPAFGELPIHSPGRKSRLRPIHCWIKPVTGTQDSTEGKPASGSVCSLLPPHAIRGYLRRHYWSCGKEDSG